MKKNFMALKKSVAGHQKSPRAMSQESAAADGWWGEALKFILVTNFQNKFSFMAKSYHYKSFCLMIF